MRIVPVLDLLDGQVVRGIAGRRNEYRPIRSVLTDKSDPPSVANAIRKNFGLNHFYIADLDAILHHRPQLGILRSLSEAGLSIMVDAGIRIPADAEPPVGAGARQVVAGLETLSGPDALSQLVHQWGANRVVFSLDLREGRPMGDNNAWMNADPFGIAIQAIEAGCTELIVLDLAQVGTGQGVSTVSLCAQIRAAFPRTTMITGGGVRDFDDLRRLAESGIDSVLIASALHDGSLTPQQLQTICR
jgi:phosphoribosylformimino-5-aminoimidazole carboxamide ribotide isomerase